MQPTFPPRPHPDPAALARAQARLLAGLSELESGPTAADDGPPPPTGQVSWLGPQGDWEAAGRREPPGSERYRFGEVFARGGLGAVRRAEDRKLGRTVAIKELLRFDGKAVRRFVREAAITARLQHPGIVPLYDLGRDDAGRPFLCMRLIEGASLEQRIAACVGLAERLALLPYVIAAAEAVAYAHGQGVIHRDLKPANILVGARGEAVVIDWGLAKDMSLGTDAEEPAGGAIEGEVSDLTTAGSLLGTLRYMPPEQARGEAVDARSDIYALGAALYHVIAGVPPFADRRSAALVREVLEGRPRPLAEHVPGVPPALVAIVEKAMSHAPGRRYADAAALADDLRRFQAGLMVGAHAYSAGEVLRLWLRRHRAVVPVAAAALVALAGVTVSAFGRIREARDAAELQRDAAATATAEAERRAQEAEAARAIAARRADALVLSQARLALDVEPRAALGLLAQLGPDPTRDGAARVLATAAWSLGGGGVAMRGPTRTMFQAIGLADGTWLAGNLDELWRWRPGATEGEMVGVGGRLVATTDGTSWAHVRGDRKGAIEVHRAGAAGPVTIALELPRPIVYYNWQMRPDGGALIGVSVLGDPTVEVLVDGGAVRTLPGPDAPPAIAGLQVFASDDGRMLAGVRDGRTLVVWDRARGAVDTAALPGPVVSFGRGWTADGAALVITCASGQVKPGAERHPWGERVFVWRRGAPARVVAASWTAAAGDRLVFIARGEGGSEAWAETIEGQRLWTRAVRTDGADDFMASPSAGRGGALVQWAFGDTFEVVDARTGALIVSRQGVRQQWELIDGTSTLVFGEDGLVRVDTAQMPWRTIAAAPPGGARWTVIAPGRGWSARDADGVVTRVDLRSGATEALGEACGPLARWTNVAGIDDAGRTLARTGEESICLWGHGRADRLRVPAHPLTGVAFAADGRFAAAFADETLLEWHDPGAPPRRLPAVEAYSLAYSPDGAALVAFGHAGEVQAIGRDGQARVVVEPSAREGYVPSAIDFAPTGARLAVFRRGEPEVRVIDVIAGTEVRLTGVKEAAAQGEVAIRHSPSGQVIAALDGETVTHWSLARPDAPGQITGVRGRAIEFVDEATIVAVQGDGGLELVDLASGTRAPLRRADGGKALPLVARGPEGLVLHTRAGEVLRFVDAVPPAGEPLRAWLAGR